MPIEGTSAQDRALPKKSRKPLIIGAAVGIVTLMVLAYFIYPSVNRWMSVEFSIDKDRVRVAMVERKDLVRDIAVQCKVIAGVSPTLFALQSGTVTFDVEIGDQISTGQQLARIESPEIENLLVREESNRQRLEVEVSREEIALRQKTLQLKRDVDLAQVNLTAAKRESQRASDAYETEAISDFDYQKAQDELQAATFGYDHAVEYMALEKERLEFELSTRKLALQQQELLVEDLQRQVDELSILSPINGVVGTVLVDQKTKVVENQALLTVVDLTKFDLDGLVPESYADDLAAGMPAEILINNRAHEARLVSISPEVVDNQVSVLMRFQHETPKGLRQNQRVSAKILMEQLDDVKVVPRGQFLNSGGGRIAYVVQDGVATKRAIDVGVRSLNAVEITRGLDVGEEVVISNYDIFRDADRVLLSQ